MQIMRRLVNAIAKPISEAVLAQVEDAREKGAEFSTQWGGGVTEPEDTQVDVATFYRTNAYFYRAVKRVADAVAMLPLTVFRPGDELKEENGPAQRLINKPNDFQTTMDFMRGVVTYLKIHGDAFIELVGNSTAKGGPPQAGGLRLLDPRRVKTKPDKRGRVAEYIYEINGRQISIPPLSVLHIQEFSPTSEHYGAGSGEALQSTLYLEQCANQYNVNGFEQGGAHGRVVFESDQVLGRAVMARMIATLKRKFFGKKKSHEFMVTERGLKARLLSTSLKDMEYLGLRKTNREEIAAGVGTPPAAIGILEYANYSNMDAQDRIFWESEVLPLVRLIENSLTAFLLPRYGDGLFCRFDLSGVGVLQENLGDWMAVVRDLIDKRIASPNECRAILADHGLPELADGYDGGDEVLVPFSLVPASAAGAMMPPSYGAPPQESASAFFEKALEDAAVTATKQIHARYLLAMARRFEPEVRAVLNDWENDISAGLSDIAKHAGYISKAQSDEVLKLMERTTMRAQDAIKERATRFHAAAIKRRGQDVLREVAGDDKALKDTELNMLSPAVQEFIRTMAGRIHDTWPATVRDRVIASVLEGANSGETINQIQARLVDVMGIERKRALMIARTEVTPSFNFANLEAYQQSGVVERKRWLTAHDEVVRETHSRAEANGPVPLHESFQPVGLQYPGEPGGAAGEVINCRCTSAPVLAKGNANATTATSDAESGNLRPRKPLDRVDTQR